MVTGSASYLPLVGSSPQTALTTSSLVTGEALSRNPTASQFAGAFAPENGQHTLQSDSLEILSKYISENIEGPVADALQSDVKALDGLQKLFASKSDPVYSLLAGGNAKSGALIDLFI